MYFRRIIRNDLKKPEILIYLPVSGQAILMGRPISKENKLFSSGCLKHLDLSSHLLSFQSLSTLGSLRKENSETAH